jgi:hypothetical protein
MNNPVDFLLAFLQKFDEGNIFLPAGSHVHKIHTKGTPLTLLFGETNTGNIPVCQGNINMYGFTLESDGFLIYAEVKSDSVELQWQVVIA